MARPDTYRILVPTDFSASSEAALATASSLAKDRANSEVMLVHVVEASVPEYDEELGVLEPESLRTKLQMLSVQREYHVQMTAELLHGNPSDEIVRMARRSHAALIVMGTRGHSAISDLIIGSVAANVLRAAPCPVLTVHVPSGGSL